MSKQKVYNYVMNTPHNTNPSVLASLLDESTSWNDLTDRPFYSVPGEVLPKTTVEIDPESGVGILPDMTIYAGDECTIKYNGTEYVSKCVDMGEGILALGNWGALDEENPVDTGEPFALIKVVSENDTLVWGVVPLDGSASVTLTVDGQIVKKIDNKYLPELASTPDWDQNDPEGAGYIKNRPFYEAIEYITYIPEQTITLSIRGTYCSTNIPDVDMPWDEVPYIVTFDGIEYEGMMRDNIDYAYIPITLEDGTSMSIYSYGSVDVYSTDYSGDHIIKVEQKAIVVHTIDNKYLSVPIYNGEGENSICINSSNNVASGYNSYAEGGSTKASGYNSHAEGDFTTASGAGSHAEGNSTTASGYNSHSEGGYTTASGDNSHAEGYGTTAMSSCQHVSGKYNIPEGKYTLKKEILPSSGSNFVGNGSSLYYAKNYSFDAETGTLTLIDPQFLGKQGGTSTVFKPLGLCYIISGGSSGKVMYYNTRDHAFQSGDKIYLYEGIRYTSELSAAKGGKYLSIIGNGKSETSRSNAHTIDWNGVGWFQGGLQVGGNAQDDGAKNVLLEGDAIPAPSVAQVGQVLSVKAVDENGKPTEWETVDKPFGDMEELLPETKFQYIEQYGIYGTSSSVDFVYGETYNINWNGVEYNTTATVGMFNDNTVIALGNPVAWDCENNNLPFALACADGIIGAIPLDGSTNVTVSIKGLKKLAERYSTNQTPYIYETSDRNFFDGSTLIIYTDSKLPLALLEAVYLRKPIYMKVLETNSDGVYTGRELIGLASVSCNYQAVGFGLMLADKTSETFKLPEGTVISGTELTTQQILMQMSVQINAQLRYYMNETDDFHVWFIDTTALD